MTVKKKGGVPDVMLALHKLTWNIKQRKAYKANGVKGSPSY